MTKILSILIPTFPARKQQFEALRIKLTLQMSEFPDYEFDILAHHDEKMSIGAKRNFLLNEATGEYLCMIDDDDDVSDNYIELLLEGINKGVDCCSLKGIFTTDGKNPELFEHSLKYDKWETISTKEGEPVHLRTPNHLNCIKSSIAKQFKFPEINFSEDHHWSKKLHNSGLLRTEHYIPEILYYYLYKSNKPK